MFKVIIVDDEPMIRQGLMDFIDWESLGCVATEAEDGVEAIRILSYSSVDIIITDISMPEVSGIDIAKFVREKNKDCKIIMITAYSEFEYAKSAVEYGVANFLMKPVNKDELVGAVCKCKSVIQTERQKRIQLIKLAQKIKDTEGEIQEKFLQDIVNLVLVNTEQLEKKAVELNIDLKQYYILTFEPIPLETDADEEIVMRNRKSIKNFLSMSFTPFHSNFASLTDKLACALISVDDATTAGPLQEIIRLCEKMLTTAKSLIPYHINIGISALHQGAEGILPAYNEALFSLSNHTDSSEPISIYRRDLGGKAESKLQTMDINNKINLIFQNIRLCRKEAAMQAIGELLNRQYHISFLRNIAMIIVSDCLKILYDYNVSESLLCNPAMDIYFSLNKAQTSHKMILVLDALIENTIHTIGAVNADENYIVNLAKKYIQKNYHKNISLQVIADYIYVNPSYLSRIYKQDTGHTITEEVNHFRIERAKELLTDTTLKKKEIATQIGIDDPIYFSRIFKKVVGVSPTEYRQSCLNNQLK